MRTRVRDEEDSYPSRKKYIFGINCGSDSSFCKIASSGRILINCRQNACIDIYRHERGQ